MALLARNHSFNSLNPLSGENDIFDSFFRPSRNWSDDKSSFLTPSVDVKENDSAYTVKADLPGIKKDDIDISLHNGVLTIKAESKYEDKEEEEGIVIRRERRLGQYMRRFSLDPNTNEIDVNAEFKDGVLTLTIPKQEPEKPQPVRIQVK